MRFEGVVCYCSITEMMLTHTSPFHRWGNKVWKRSWSLPKVKLGVAAKT